MSRFASLQSVAGAATSASPLSAQSASMDEMLKMVRKPSLSPSTKQSSRPSQFWSIPSPVSSSAPGFTPGSESAQSRSFST